jgi:hypothetical protein
MSSPCEPVEILQTGVETLRRMRRDVRVEGESGDFVGLAGRRMLVLRTGVSR